MQNSHSLLLSSFSVNFILRKSCLCKKRQISGMVKNPVLILHTWADCCLGGSWFWDGHWPMPPHLPGCCHWGERLWKLLHCQGVLPWQRPGESYARSNGMPKQDISKLLIGTYFRVWPFSLTLNLLTLVRVRLPLLVPPYLTSTGSTFPFSARAG